MMFSPAVVSLQVNDAYQRYKDRQLVSELDA